MSEVKNTVEGGAITSGEKNHNAVAAAATFLASRATLLSRGGGRRRAGGARPSGCRRP